MMQIATTVSSQPSLSPAERSVRYVWPASQRVAEDATEGATALQARMRLAFAFENTRSSSEGVATMDHMSRTDDASAAPGRLDSERRSNIGFSTAAIRILDAIRGALEQNPEGALAAAVQLATLLADPAAVEQAGARGGLAPWQKRKVDRYLRERIVRSPQVSEVAAQVSLSANHFSQAFKQAFGTSPHAYIIRLRVERAQRLMLVSGDSLAEIALACGFAHQAHFSTTFRRIVGATPGAWRRRSLTDCHRQMNSRQSGQLKNRQFDARVAC